MSDGGISLATRRMKAEMGGLPSAYSQHEGRLRLVRQGGTGEVRRMYSVPVPRTVEKSFPSG